MQLGRLLVHLSLLSSAALTFLFPGAPRSAAQDITPTQVTDQNRSGDLPFSGTVGTDVEHVVIAGGNLVVNIPFISVPGRGKSFNFGIWYDNRFLVTTTNTSSSKTTDFWGAEQRFYITPQGLWSATQPGIAYTYYTTTCGPTLPGQPPNGLITGTKNYVYVDESGGKHSFDAEQQTGQCQHQPTGWNFSSPGPDNSSGSGAFLKGPPNTGTSPTTAFVELADGTTLTAGGPNGSGGQSFGSSLIPELYGLASVADTNGNSLEALPGGVDTLGRDLVVLQNSTNSLQYIVTDSSGTSQTFTVNYMTAKVSTAFGVSDDNGAIKEYSSSRQLVTSINLPNGRSYGFGYDAYGSMTSMTLPTGATIAYQWTNFLNSACTYRYVSKRTLTVGNQVSVWTFSQAPIGTLSCDQLHHVNSPIAVTMTDPLGNQSVYQINQGNVTSAALYSGTATGTPLRLYTINYTNYNSVVWPPLNLPTQIITQLENQQVSEKDIAYDTLTYPRTSCPGGVCGSGGPVTSNNTTSRGNVTDIWEYDWGQGSHGALLRHTTKTYLQNSNGAYSSANIVNKVLTDTIYDGSGNQQAQTQYEYDNYVPGDNPMQSTSEAAQHDYTHFSSSATLRGNATRVKRWRNTDGALLTTTYTYDDLGNIRAIKDPLSNTTTYDYTDSFANSSCPPPTGQTGQAYATTSTNPLGQQVKVSHYPCTGLLQSHRDQNDLNASRPGTTYLYDLLGRQTQKKTPDGGELDTTYNDVPPVSTTTTTKINPTQNLLSKIVKDGLGRPTQTQLNSDPDCSTGDKTDRTYDALGHVNTVSNPYCSTSDPTYGLTTNTYDALGRTCVVAPPTGTPQSSCPAAAIAGDVATVYTGRATAVFDEGNGTKSVERISQVDGLGRLVSVCEVTSASQLGSSGTPAACGQDISATGFLTTYGYDTLDNLTSVTQSGLNGRTFQYDSLSRLASSTNPESGTTSYTYDKSGNVLTKTDSRNITICFGDWNGTSCNGNTGYDALNRNLKKTYSDGTPTATFNYDQTSALGVTLTNTIGRKSSESTAGTLPTGSVSSYDSMGRIADNSQCTPQNCGTGVFAFQYPQYDFLGDLISGTNAAGVTFTYSYSTAARLTGITTNFVDASHPGTLLSSATYYAPGLLKSVLLGNGITETRNYNPRLWMTSFTAGTAYSLNMASYAPDGDVLAANDSANGNWTYSYDDFNRLSGSNQSSGQSVYSYVYDRFGNRWQQNGQHSMQLSFSGANNRMDGYSYDAAGNLQSDGSHSYFYDAENRLIQVDGTLGNCSTATACYVYDAEGRRVRKTTSAATLDFLYDAEGHKVAEVDTTGTFQRGELYAGDRHLAVYAPDPGPTGATFFIHADWLGTERTRTDMNGTACETITSLPFGDGQTISDSCGDSAGDVSPMHFTGKEHDPESGLDNFGARYNSSSFGRFMSPDPLAGHTEDPQTLNRYAYVRNNPLNLTDPTGLDFYLSCQKASTTCQKDAAGNLVQGTTTTDANGKSTFNATVVTSASLQDSNSGNTATVNENGVQITTAQGTSQGIFINGTDAANVQGSGKLSDVVFHIDSSDEKKGTLDAGTYTYEGSRNQADVVKGLTDKGAFQYTAEKVFGNPFHPGDLNFRFSSGSHPNLFDYGPSSHLLVPQDPKATVPVGPGYVGNFHVDSHTGSGRHGACAIAGVGCQ